MYTSNDVNINTLFEAKVSGNIAAATGFNINDADLNTMFEKKYSTRVATETGFTVNDADLNTIFEKLPDYEIISSVIPSSYDYTGGIKGIIFPQASYTIKFNIATNIRYVIVGGGRNGTNGINGRVSVTFNQFNNGNSGGRGGAGGQVLYGDISSNVGSTYNITVHGPDANSIFNGITATAGGGPSAGLNNETSISTATNGVIDNFNSYTTFGGGGGAGGRSVVSNFGSNLGKGGGTSGGGTGGNGSINFDGLPGEPGGDGLVYGAGGGGGGAGKSTMTISGATLGGAGGNGYTGVVILIFKS